MTLLLSYFNGLGFVRFLHGNGLGWTGVDAGHAEYAILRPIGVSLLRVAVLRRLLKVPDAHRADLDTHSGADALVPVDSYLARHV